MTPLGFVAPDDEDSQLVGVGQADAQPGGQLPQPIAQTVTLRVERDNRALLLVALLALVALVVRR
jgi:hypothetical protein